MTIPTMSFDVQDTFAGDGAEADYAYTQHTPSQPWSTQTAFEEAMPVATSSYPWFPSYWLGPEDMSDSLAGQTIGDFGYQADTNAAPFTDGLVYAPSPYLPQHPDLSSSPWPGETLAHLESDAHSPTTPYPAEPNTAFYPSPQSTGEQAVVDEGTGGKDKKKRGKQRRAEGGGGDKSKPARDQKPGYKRRKSQVQTPTVVKDESGRDWTRRSTLSDETTPTTRSSTLLGSVADRSPTTVATATPRDDKNFPSFDDDDEARTTMPDARLGYNRDAAAKSRRKTSIAERQLESTAIDLREKNTRLTAEQMRLRDEVYSLKTELFRHSDCCPEIQDYLVATAKEIAADPFKRMR